MTVIEWIRFSILIVAIVFSITFSIVVLVKSKKEGFTRKRTATLILVSGLLFIIYLASNVQEIRPAGALQVMLMLGLLSVTGTYAVFTGRQAEASVKMAEEMKEQRYDAVHPVIDIQKEESPDAHVSQGLVALFEDTSRGLSCILHNIGIGPAIGVYSFIEDARGETCRRDFVSIPVAIGEEEMGYTHEMPLSLQQRDEHKALVVCYEVVYGNFFKSSREVTLNKEKSACEIGSLQIRPIKEDELP